MEETLFIKVALEEYLIDCNTIDICIENYRSRSKINSMSEVILSQDNISYDQKPPNFFAQYANLQRLYKEDGYCEKTLDELKNKLLEWRENKYKSYIIFLNDILAENGIKINLEDKYNEIQKDLRQHHATAAEARIKAYFKLLEAVRIEEEH